jgi:hypothetical protein
MSSCPERAQLQAGCTMRARRTPHRPVVIPESRADLLQSAHDCLRDPLCKQTKSATCDISGVRNYRKAVRVKVKQSPGTS